MGVPSAATAPQASTATAPLVRRNIWTLPGGDQTVEEYAQAVAIMQGRPAKDPTSWTYQAAMHGTHAQSVQPLWNGCQHGTWFFLAWHRMFIYYFEQIVRAAVVQAGSADWSLPFWDYGAGGQQATLPAAFRSQTVNGAPNPLFESARAPGINRGLALSPAVASATRVLRASRFVGTSQFGGGVTGVAQFSNSTGQVENQPHNVIHDAVGGNGGLMADPDAAAADPIFWVHHANIDRLWFIWTGPRHLVPNDPRWTGQTFSFFDAHGQRVTKTPTDVLDIIGQLGYTYEVAPPAGPAGVGGIPVQPTAEDVVTGPEPPEGEPELVGASETPVRLVGAPASVALQIDQQAHQAALAATGATAPQRILLSVEDIEAAQNPGTVYGIYVNLPADASADVAESHHAGNVSFFGVERARDPRGDEHAHGLRLVHDITELTQSLAAQGEWDGHHVEVTFRPLGLIPQDQPELAHALPDVVTETDPPVTIGRVAIFYE